MSVDSTSNAFSYAVGGIALFSTLASVFLYLRVYLPGAQMKVLTDLLEETWQIYHKANAEGLLPPEVSSAAYTKLLRLESEGDILREITYKALSSCDKVRDLFHGHTTRIMRLANHVCALRAKLMTTSQKEKARRIAEEREAAILANSDNTLNNISEPSLSVTDTSDDPSQTSATTQTNSSTIAQEATLPNPSSANEAIGCTSCCICSLVRWWSRQIRLKQPKNQLSGETPMPATQGSDIASLTSTVVGDPFPSSPWFRLPSLVERTRTQPVHSGDVPDRNDPDNPNYRAISAGRWDGQSSPKIPQVGTAEPARDVASLPV